MSESDLMKRIQVRASQLGYRLFRNNVAKAWVSSRVYVAPKNSRTHHVLVGPGDVVCYNARPLNAGLGVGTSDLIGWETVTITPDMVGSTLAVFTAAEIKYGRGRVTEEQKNFLEVVRRAGGYGILAYSIEDFENRNK